MLRLFKWIAPALVLGACTSPDQSTFIYQLPYEDGTEVSIWQDHLTHANNEPAIDMAATDPSIVHAIVAARPGIVRRFRDTEIVNCMTGCNNNYIWLQHTGAEWTKYTHLVPGSVTGPIAAGGANLSIGDSVAAGQIIGLEGNIGIASGSNNGRHLHFEVREVSNPVDPIPDPQFGDLNGPMKIPRFCGVPGAIVSQGELYNASACPN